MFTGVRPSTSLALDCTTGLSHKVGDWMACPDSWLKCDVTADVIESMAFDWPTTPLPGPEEPKDPNAGWYCLEYVLTTSREVENSMA